MAGLVGGLFAEAPDYAASHRIIPLCNSGNEQLDSCVGYFPLQSIVEPTSNSLECKKSRLVAGIVIRELGMYTINGSAMSAMFDDGLANQALSVLWHRIL